MAFFRSRLALAGLILLFAGISIAWLALDRSPAAWDDGAYLSASISMYDTLTEHGVLAFLKKTLTITSIRPPLITILPAPVYLLFGRDPRNALLVNLVFLVVTLLAVNRIAANSGGERAGLIAVYVAGTMPMIYALSRWYLTECALIAITCVCVWLLLELQREYNTYRIAALGFLCGLGLLLKASFPLYVAAPLLWFVWSGRRAPRRLAVPGLAAPALLLAAPWYVVNLAPALATLQRAGTRQTAQLYGWGNILSLRALADWALKIGSAAPAIYVLLLAAVLAARSRGLNKSEKEGLLLCGLWVSPALFLAFSHYREARYAAPLFPAMAVATGILLAPLMRRRAGIAVAGAVLAIPFVGLIQCSFGLLSGVRFGWLLQAWEFPYAVQYDRTAWPHQALLADIARLRPASPGARSLVTIATDSERFNADNFTLAALVGRLPFDVSTTAWAPNADAAVRQVCESSYTLYREGGEDRSPYDRFGAAVFRELQDRSRFIEVPISRKLPDGGIAHVYANLQIGRFLRKSAFFHSAAMQLADDVPSQTLVFGGRLRLEAFSADTLPPGMRVRFLWRSVRPLDFNWRCFMHVLNERGAMVNVDHDILAGQPPLTTWRAGDAAYEEFLIPSAELPRGIALRLRFGFFRPDTGERLHVDASTLPTTDGETAILAAASAP